MLKILAAVAGAALLALGLVRYSFSERPVVKAALLLLGAALMLPLIVGLIRTKKPAAGKPATKPNAKIFFGCAAFLALFIGGYIPASVISSSAQEFVNVQMYYSPIWFCHQQPVPRHRHLCHLVRHLLLVGQPEGQGRL